MSKPSSKDAPYWAKFLAMQSDGNWWWFEEKPEWVDRDGDGWWYLRCGPRRQIAAPAIDYKLTLERVADNATNL